MFLSVMSHKVTIFATKFRRNMDSAAQKIASSIEAMDKGKIFFADDFVSTECERTDSGVF